MTQHSQNSHIAITRETPFFILINAASGSTDVDQERAKIEAVLTSAQQRFTILAFNDPQEIVTMAQHAAHLAETQNGAVIVAGGDGTINAAVQAVLPTGRPLGIIPQGTFNYSSRAHGIPFDAESATRSLLQPHLKPVQVGVLNGRVFLVNASVGLYPQSLQDREAYKKQYGRTRLVALWSAIMTLLRGHGQLTLEIKHDQRSEVISTPTLFVGNNLLQLEQIGLPEGPAVEQGRLAAVIVRPVGTAGLFWLALRGAFGLLGDAADIRNFSFQRMTVRPRSASPRRGFKVATDGEVWWASSPLQFSVAAKPLLLMTPAVSDPS